MDKTEKIRLEIERLKDREILKKNHCKRGGLERIMSKIIIVKP